MQRNSKSKPIIIYSYRKVKDGKMDKYNKKAKSWADYCKKHVQSFKTNTYCEFPDAVAGDDRKDWVADIQFFNSITAFRKHMFFRNPIGLIKTLKFLGGTDNQFNFTGYGFGDWNKSVFLGVNLPRMFSMMPPPKWFEMRRDLAGFIRDTAAPDSKPPLFLFCDFHINKDDDAKNEFIGQWNKVAMQNSSNPNVIAFQLTEEEIGVKLLDKQKKRDPYKLVGVMAFMDLPTLEESVGKGLKGINNHLALPAKIDIWAGENNARTSAICAKTFGDTEEHTLFNMDHGWSDHTRV